MAEITVNGYPIVFTAKTIRDLYDSVVKYYDFDYTIIQMELQSAFIRWGDEYEYPLVFSKTRRIDHLSDDFEILFSVVNFRELCELKGKYLFLNDDIIFGLLVFSLNFIPRLRDNSLNLEALYIDRANDIPVTEEKRKLYEFLVDNFREFNSKNMAKTQVTLRYGMDTQVDIDNYNNWFYDLIRRELHKQLTFAGIEYERHIELEKPSRTPSFGNFIAYNTYLLLKDKVGSDKMYPAEFLKFIIDFCALANIKLEGRQSEVLGMKDLIKSAVRQYDNEPMPFSLVRQ